MKKIKIGLVEDDSFLANMYETKLNLEGFEVKKALDGQEGIEMIKQEKPDVILLDILLPKMDGWEVLNALKKEESVKDIPVILLTNLSQKNDIEKGMGLKVEDYLIKAHFTPSEVVDKVKKVLGTEKK